MNTTLVVFDACDCEFERHGHPKYRRGTAGLNLCPSCTKKAREKVVVKDDGANDLRILSCEEVVGLARERKAVTWKGNAKTRIVPAAILVNWQAIRLVSLLKNNVVKLYRSPATRSDQ